MKLMSVLLAEPSRSDAVIWQLGAGSWTWMLRPNHWRKLTMLWSDCGGGDVWNGWKKQRKMSICALVSLCQRMSGEWLNVE